MKKYLEDLRQELVKQKLSNKEIEEIIADHEEMIRTAMEDGLSEDEIKAKFGKPEQVAEDLADNDGVVEGAQEDSEDYQLWKSYPVNKDQINLNVSLLSEDITYQLSDNDEIKVYFEGKGKVDKYEISYEKNEFRLYAPKKMGFYFSYSKSDSLRFLVELPKFAIIKEFKHVSLSSDAEFNNLTIQQMIINTTSGDLLIANNQIKSIKLNSVSGDCSIKDSKIDEINQSQVSGDTELLNVTISGDFKANTVSGDLNLENVTCNHFDAHSVSGDVDGKEFYPHKVSLRSVSGDVNISNKENRYIEILRKSTVSGDICISK